MPDERFTVRLDEEQARWVEDEAERRDRSRAYILREVVDLARGADSMYGDAGRTGSTRNDAERTDATRTAPDRAAPGDDDSDDQGETTSTTRSTSSPEAASGEPSDVDGVEAVVTAVSANWGGSPERLADRRDAARAVLELLAEEGQVSKQLAIDVLLPEFEVTDQSPDTWWRKNCREVVREVATYSNGAHAYVLDEDSPLALGESDT